MNQLLHWYQQQQKNALRLGTALAESYASNLELVNAYGSIYRRALEGAVEEHGRPFDSTAPGGSVASLYETWIKHNDRELQKELKSREFLSLLSGYTDSMIELHSAYRAAGYPVDYFDRLLDSFRQTLRIPLSVSKDFKLAPHDVVYRKGKVRLLHYRGADGRKGDEGRHGHPLLIVYAPINQFHIMDLNDRKSVVRNLLSNGLDVYLLDWGYRGLKDSGLSLNDYIDQIHHAVQTIRQQAGTEKVSMLGYCWGGIFALVYAALHNDDVRNLALMATPVDFSRDYTALGTWSRAVDIVAMMEEFGRLDGQVLDMVFLMRNPPRYSFDKYLKLLKRMNDEEFVGTFIDTESWLYDTPSVPGRLHSQIINDCYKNNLLASNKMEIDGQGRKIDLRKVTVPLLTIVAERDDIVSMESALAVNDCVSSKEKATLRNPGGHVALCIGNKAHGKLWPEVAKWIISK